MTPENHLQRAERAEARVRELEAAFKKMITRVCPRTPHWKDDPEIVEAYAIIAKNAEGLDYAWPTIKDHNDCVGYQTNDDFNNGWRMARTTSKTIGIAQEVKDHEAAAKKGTQQ